MEITKINFDENTLRDIKNNLVALNLNSFANIIDDAEQVIFGGSTIDSEFLNLISPHYYEMLKEENDHYEHVSKDEFIVTDLGKKRELDKLISAKQPAIDSSYLALHAIHLCNMVLNQFNTGIEYTAILREASEAIGASRFTSAYINAKDERDYYFSQQNTSPLSPSDRAIESWELRNKYLENFYGELKAIALAIWEHEPYIRYGVVSFSLIDKIYQGQPRHSANAKKISQFLYEKGFTVPSARKMNQYFKDCKFTPQTAIKQSTPRFIKLSNNIDARSYPELAAILLDRIDSNLVKLINSYATCKK